MGLWKKSVITIKDIGLEQKMPLRNKRRVTKREELDFDVRKKSFFKREEGSDFNIRKKTIFIKERDKMLKRKKEEVKERPAIENPF